MRQIWVRVEKMDDHQDISEAALYSFADLIRAMSEDLEALRELHRAVAKAHEQAAKEGK